MQELKTTGEFYAKLCDLTNQAFALRSKYSNSKLVRKRQALLKIEQHLKDPLDMLADWRLLPMLGSSNDTIASRIKKAGRIKLGGKLSLALLDLKNLPYLELSNNDFDPTQIPNWFRA
ncbi:hypothetical protein Gotri_002190 [Gossypium trilobum]|uniref:Uncharacterized protein n=1 Tax=Gossypium trilobum TaxID=34281 RepID=A0A7J9F7H1_9ROSI|nr:hypothetical protein [Gossypium trilobum]